MSQVLGEEEIRAVNKVTSYFVTAKKIQRTKENKIRGGSRRKGSH